MSHGSEVCARLLQFVAEGSIAEEEVRQILSHRVGHAQYGADGPGRVQYVGPEGVYLTLVYGKRELKRIDVGTALPTEVLDGIMADVEAELGPPSWIVRRGVVFSAVPTDGAWRYGGLFQLVPPPPNAPRPPFLIGDHPLVLEVRVRRSANFMTMNLRTARELNKVSLLLGLILRHGLTLPPRSARRHWVYLVDQEQPELKLHSEFLQVGYNIDEFQLEAQGFSDGLPDCPIIHSDAYYKLQGIVPGDPLAVPDLASSYLDRYFALDPLAQHRFLRACYWWNRANEAWAISHSMSWTGLVQAVEVLIDSPRGTATCPTCGLRRGPGPTRQFMEFVEQFAPGIDEKTRRDFYDTRSQLDHGGPILLADEEEALSPGLHPSAVDEMHAQDALRNAVRAVLLNFLMGDQTSKYIGLPPKSGTMFMRSVQLGSGAGGATAQ